MRDRGLFVVFEGGDRVGKSTQVRALAAALELSGIDHVITFEPGDTAAGSQVRQLLLDPESDLDDRCETLLYAADKAQHVTRVVLPALAAGKVVVSDRYVDSMLAYQGSGRGLDGGTLAALAGAAASGPKSAATARARVDRFSLGWWARMFFLCWDAWAALPPSTVSQSRARHPHCSPAGPCASPQTRGAPHELRGGNPSKAVLAPAMGHAGPARHAAALRGRRRLGPRGAWEFQGNTEPVPVQWTP